MSVVNTMLRELAERQTSTDANVLPLATATAPPRRLPRGVLIAIPVAVAAILLWRLGVFSTADERVAGSVPMAPATASSAETIAPLRSPATALPADPDRDVAVVITTPAATTNATETNVPNPAITTAATATVKPGSNAAPASIGWEEVDFATLDRNADGGIDETEPVTENAAPASPVEPVTFERTPATENASALLARARQQARQAIAAGNWQEANEAIRTGTAVAPDDPELALLHVESEALRDPSVAEQTATAVLNELPHAWPVRQWLGLRWLQMQQAQRAYAVLTTLAPPISTAPDYHTVLALAAQQSGEHAAAVTLYQQLISLQPTQGRHQAGLAMSLEALGNTSGARSAWQQALRDPQLPAALIRYGQSRLQQLPTPLTSAQASP